MVWVGYADEASGLQYQSILSEVLAALTAKQEVVALAEAEAFLNNARYQLKQQKVLADKIRFMVHSPLNMFLQEQGTVLLSKGDAGSYCLQFEGTDSVGLKTLLAENYNMQTGTVDWAIDPAGLQVNSQGVMVQVWDYVQAHYPELSREAYEEKVADLFGVKEVIWLEKGLSTDPKGFGQIHEQFYGFGTGGEINRICRFANDTTLVLAWPTEFESTRHPIMAVDHERMKQNYEILTRAKRPDGEAYSVVKIPVPDLQYQERIVDVNLQQVATDHGLSLAIGDTIYLMANTSYMAYVLSNRSLAVPQYWAEGLPFSLQLKDGEAEGFFQRLFPKAMIKHVHPLRLNYEGKSAYNLVLTIPGEKEAL